MSLKTDAIVIAGLVAAGALALWWVTRPGRAGTLASGAVRAVGDVAVGTVKGIGQLVGIPDTNQSQCQQHLAAGQYWEASFSCPASTFLGAAVFPSTNISASMAADGNSVPVITENGGIQYPYIYA